MQKPVGSRLWLLLLLLLYGCHKENTLPDIYVDQTSETLMNGENTIRKQYREAVEICRSLDKKVRELPEEEVEKLGTSRYQLVITSEKIASRKESWGFSMKGHYHNPGECRFSLVYSGDLTVKTPGKTIIYDLDENTIVEEEQGIPEAFGLPFRPLPDMPDAVETKQPDTPEAKRADREVYGQPVAEWTHPDGSVEVLWSGGRQWGFSELPSEEMFAVPGSMILEREQKKENFTTKLKTRRFTVGPPVDMEPFARPEGLESSP